MKNMINKVGIWLFITHRAMYKSNTLFKLLESNSKTFNKLLIIIIIHLFVLSGLTALF